MRSRRHRPASRQRRGSALLLVLGVSALILILLLAVLSLSVRDRSAAQSDGDAARAALLADSALAEVMAKLDEGLQAGLPANGQRRAHLTAAPGLMEIRRYDVPWNRGAATGAKAFASDGPLLSPFENTYDGQPANPRWIPLFSRHAAAPAVRHLSRGNAPGDLNPEFNPGLMFNLNTPRNPFHPGVHYLSGFQGPASGRALTTGGTAGLPAASEGPALLAGQSTAERPLWVQWIPVAKDPALPPGPDNPLIGRYAYWVDVENTRTHLAAAGNPLRGSTLFPLAVGDPDGNSGARQDGDSPSRHLRQAMEDAGDAGGALRLAGASLTARQIGTGFSPVVARRAFESWLGPAPDGGSAPAAGAVLTDWDSLLSPTGAGQEGTRPDEILSGAASWLRRSGTPPGFSVWDVLTFPRPSPAARGALPMLRQLAASALTVSGYEDETDPLGLPRLDLVKFQLEALQGGLSAIRAHPLWKRLSDPAYYPVYYPGSYPTSGKPRSLLQSLNSFAGDGRPDNDANGAAALLQMLVNVAEYASPADRAPLIDAEAGITGARSLPYIAEVTTRARSALWMLPEADRNNTATLLARDPGGRFSYVYNGKDFAWYATHVLVDLTFAPVNQNPLETEPFDGELELDLTWARTPPGADLTPSDYRAPLQGYFNAMPASGKKPGSVRLAGNGVTFPLGVFSHETLEYPETTTAMCLSGWRIVKNGRVFHQVPLRHPGQTSPPVPWYAMAAGGRNAGSYHDFNSLAAWQYRSVGIEAAVPEPQLPARHVGWFTNASRLAMQPDSIALGESRFRDPPTETDLRYITDFLERARLSARVERVAARDPVLGHRTGNPDLTGLYGSGHFYGMLGHPWRRVPPPGRDSPVSAEAQPARTGQTYFDSRELEAPTFLWQSSGESGQSVTVSRTRHFQLQPESVSLRWPVFTAQPGPPQRLRYATQFWLYPFENQVLDPEPPTSPTALLMSPAMEGNPPLVSMSVKLAAETGIPREPTYLDQSGQVIVGAKAIKDTDIETASALSDGEYTKIPAQDKGPRSFFSHAPRGRAMTSLGELGFVHSGLSNLPILTGPDIGRTIHQVNAPQLGPPMRMLLDLLCPAPVLTPEGGEIPPDRAASGAYVSHSPSFPRRGLWNVNTTVAQDSYMALREGGTRRGQLKTSVFPTTSARVAWIPAADGNTPRSTGSEAHRGKELAQFFDPKKPVPGSPLDRNLSPFLHFPRAWDAWLNVIGGDYTPTRALGGRLWGPGNNSRFFFGPGAFTWMPGRVAGVGSSTPSFVDFDPESPGLGKLFAFGTDARNNDKTDGAGQIKGRWAADQNLDALQPGAPVFQPATDVTRLTLFPMRHFLSDLPLETHGLETWADLRTALNPQHDSRQVRNTTEAAAADFAAFPGGWASSGIYYHAPLALLTNQASTSANAFTIHLITQTIRDKGTVKPGQPNSGPGFCDIDDTVLAEHWIRLTVEQPDPASPRLQTTRRESASQPPAF